MKKSIASARALFLIGSFALAAFLFALQVAIPAVQAPRLMPVPRAQEQETDPEEMRWQQELTREQYQILRKKGTERPYTSPLVDEHRKGTYYAVDTKEPLFRSEDKFDSGTGWPSFTRPISPDAIMTAEDTQYDITRTEVLTKAGGHLGHVFSDGPEPTGLRYCMNGIALFFVPDAE